LASRQQKFASGYGLECPAIRPMNSYRSSKKPCCNRCALAVRPAAMITSAGRAAVIPAHRSEHRDAAEYGLGEPSVQMIASGL
jgi:hypothetical protein